MAKRLNTDQEIVMRLAEEELFRGNRVTISCKKFGHSRKFGGECDLVANSKPLRKPSKEVKRDAG